MSRSFSPASATHIHHVDNVSPSVSRSSSHSSGGFNGAISAGLPKSASGSSNNNNGSNNSNPSSAPAHAFTPRSASSYEDYDYLCKLLVIGDSGCGKSSLLKRFSDDQWNPNYSSTIGVDFEVRSVDVITERGQTKVVKLQMWDTAGQERFRTITSSYYRGAHAVLIVFDVTNEESFQNVRKWLAELDQITANSVNRSGSSSSHQHGQNGNSSQFTRSAQVLLVANKSDLSRSRVVESHRIAALADELNLKFIESSAKLNTGVTESFQTIANAFVQQRMKEEHLLDKNGNIGGPGGKQVRHNFNGLRMDQNEDEDDEDKSALKKCLGSCSIM